MKFAFVTCVQLGLSCIEKIYEIGGSLDLLITLNDNKSIKKSGRIYLDKFAEDNNVELFKINHINDDDVYNKLRSSQIDWLFIIGWSQIANKRLLEAPLKGAIGMHPTLLPEGRGRAAIPWAILKGLAKTGVTMFKLAEGVDTGPILSAIEIALTDETNATDLYGAVNNAHKELIEKTWYDLVNDSVEMIDQRPEAATYWPGRKPEDGEIKSEMNMEQASRLVRATTKPYPGAYYIQDNKKVIVWSAKTAQFISAEVDVFIRLADGYLCPDLFDVSEVETK